jgi:FkbM family methyltransferase
MSQVNFVRNNKFALIGAGKLGMSIVSKLSDLKIKPLFIADSKVKEERTIYGDCWIRNYKYLKHFEDKNLLLVVTIFNPKASFSQIKKQLKEYGFNNVISFITLCKIYPDQFLPFLNYNILENFKKDKVSINNFSKKLIDSKSIEIFNNNLKARKKFNLELHSIADSNDYFPQDLFEKSLLNESLYIDCGAYDGDTVRSFVSNNQNFSRVIAFEPDNSNFQKLLKEIYSYKSVLKNRILCYPVGLSNVNEIKMFSGDMGMGSSIDKNGNLFVQVVALDSFLSYIPENKVFIKLDVEGFELAAIKGMKKLIKTKSPFLAISVYHKFDDIWKIGNYVSKLNENYHFYLRQHGNDGMDLILYCKIKE